MLEFVMPEIKKKKKCERVMVMFDIKEFARWRVTVNVFEALSF